MTDTQLHPAGIEDLAEVLTWIPDAQAFERWTGPYVAYPTTPEKLWKEIRPAVDNAFVLLEGGHHAGFGQVLTHFRPDTLHLARIIINPQFRGRGYGRILCTRLMAVAARQHPHAAFSLNVHRQNQVAINLYSSLGFRPHVIQPREDVLLMVKPG